MSRVDIEQVEIVTRKLSELIGWDKNPRTVKDKDYDRLVAQIKRLGVVYKPLIINQNNIVLGGNMRLQAFEELGLDEVLCARVLTDNEAQMMEIALSDNDQIGTTDEQKVAAFNAEHPIKTELYALNSSPMKLVSTVVKQLSPGNGPENQEPKCRECPLHCGLENL